VSQQDEHREVPWVGAGISKKKSLNLCLALNSTWAGVFKIYSIVVIFNRAIKQSLFELLSYEIETFIYIGVFI